MYMRFDASNIIFNTYILTSVLIKLLKIFECVGGRQRALARGRGQIFYPPLFPDLIYLVRFNTIYKIADNCRYRHDHVRLNTTCPICRAMTRYMRLMHTCGLCLHAGSVHNGLMAI
jgi:hypothetical protein